MEMEIVINKLLCDNNELLAEVNKKDDNDTTERTFSKIFVKHALALANPNDMASVLSDGGKSLAIGGNVS